MSQSTTTQDVCVDERCVPLNEDGSVEAAQFKDDELTDNSDLILDMQQMLLNSMETLAASFESTRTVLLQQAETMKDVRNFLSKMIDATTESNKKLDSLLANKHD